MQLTKLKWFVLPATGILLTTWITVALQNRRVDDNALKNAGKNNTEDWLTYGLNYQEQRYSLLKQIDTDTVKRLGLAWTYEIGPGGGNQEGTPLVSNGVLYSITNWSITYAVDVRTGKELWRYDPKVDRTMQGRICCGVVNRGLGIYQGKIYVPVIDGRLVALDAATGTELWSAMTVPPGGDYSVTMAPRIAKGKVIIGNAGSEYPVRGYVTAYDAQTGKQAWRFFTVPGDPKAGFESKAMEAAAKTWSGEWYKYGGGGTVWDGMAYDPDSNLIYFGTGNGGPWPSDFRQSKGLDNLYVCSVLALDVDTGEYKWHYQFVPEDSWDFDSVQQLTLADIRVNGQLRKVIMQANKNGFFYVLDRLKGTVISAAPFAQVNWASEIDIKTGRPMIRPEAFYGKDRAIQIFPGPGGAHNWAPMSFNPALNLMYIPASANSSSTYRLPDSFTYQAGRTNMGVAFGGGPPPGGRGGPPGPPGPPAPPNPAATGGIAEPGAAAGAGFNVPTGPAPGANVAPALPSVGPVDKDGKFYTGSWLIAIDPSTQKEKWRAQGGGSIGGGTLTTAGNLVLQTTNQGHLIAYRADTGEKLLDLATNQTGGMGPPITFMVDNKQYVAVAGGIGARGGFGPAGPGGPGAPGGALVPPPAGGPGAAPGAAAGAPSAQGQGQRANAPAAPAVPPAPPVLPRLYVYVLDGKAVNPTPEPPPAPAGGFGGFGGFGPPPGAPAAPGAPGAPPATAPPRGQ
jgi:quinohemoprotein ethanol dehydrogenase